MNDGTKKIGIFSYIIAGISFIPLIGIPFALISIVIGIFKYKYGGIKLIVMGIIGIALTIGLYGTLYYQTEVKQGGIFDELQSKLNQKLLHDLVKNIEYYKLQNEAYPATLPVVLQSMFPEIENSQAAQTMNAYGAYAAFYYQLEGDGNHYYLLVVGADNQPFTADDMVPDISEEERAKTGLLIKGQ